MQRPGLRSLTLIFATAALLQPATAQSEVDQKAFVFGGRFSSEFIEFALNPFTTTFEDNYILGAGYQRFFLGEDGGFKLGGEIGTALRFGNQASTEIWAGPVLRADKFIRTEDFALSASVTAGLSVSSGTIGIEAQREIDENGDSTLLYYFGPEVSLTLPGDNDVEVFWRLHHRSGGWKSLGNMRDSANATSVGVRWSF